MIKTSEKRKCYIKDFYRQSVVFLKNCTCFVYISSCSQMFVFKTKIYYLLLFSLLRNTKFTKNRIMEISFI